MDINYYFQPFQAKQKEIEDFMRCRMPAIVGRIAKDHFQDNFIRGGFVNGGLHKWAESKRLAAGGSSAYSRNGTLLSGSRHLFSSINYYPTDYRVRIATDVPYAPVHNWGGQTSPTVTDRMRRFAWRKFYEASGIERKNAKDKKKRSRSTKTQSENPQAAFWKRLALTKKQKLTVKIPQRQFLGESKELEDAITARIEKEITRILNF